MHTQADVPVLLRVLEVETLTFVPRSVSREPSIAKIPVRRTGNAQRTARAQYAPCI
ncbi:MAG: hypothetical protein LBF66_00345 [Holosporales bacterium]|nr:hypothetical protein [Holosporales bacterium]